MRWLLGVIKSGPATPTNVCKRQRQTAKRSQYGAEIAVQRTAEHRAADRREQRQAIREIRRPANASLTDGNLNPIAHLGTDVVADPIGFGGCTEHLGQVLPTATALLMTTTTAALGDLDHCITAVDSADDCFYRTLSFTHACYQRLSEATSSKGRNFAATASRARKIRERTVPIGQFIMVAISS